METEKTSVLKTGTTTVAIVCKDGLVIAADKRATAGNLIADRRAQKLHFITDNIVVSISGTVSDAQMIVRLVQSELQLKKLRSYADVTVNEAANFTARVVYSAIRRSYIIPAIAHFLMAGKDATGMYVYDIFADGSLSPIRDFVASGSGSVMAYGLLENSYHPNISVDDGVKLALQCINAAIARDSASGNGIDIVTITAKGAHRVMDKEINYKIEM